MMKHMLLALLILFIALPVLQSNAYAVGGTWKGDYVRVINAADPSWRPLITQAVADLNAAMPESGPQFVVTESVKRKCKVGQHKKRRTIVICSTEVDATHNLGHVGRTRGKVVRGHIVSPVIVRLGGDASPFPPQWDQNTLCHELMHAAAWAPEKMGQDSCVSNEYLTTFGPADIAFLQRMYGH